MNSINPKELALHLGIYLIIILVIALKFFPKKSINLYQERGKSFMWIFISAGMFTSIFNFSSDLLFLEAVAEKGFSGLWLLSSGIFAIGFSPILFGPFWSKLKLSTENEFCLFRYSGNGAKALQIFRAIYLGCIVVPLLISFHLLAFQKFSSLLFGWNPKEALSAIIICLSILLFKNSFRQEVRINTLNGIIQIIAMFIVFYYSIQLIDGSFINFWSHFKENNSELINIFPSHDQTKGENDLWVFLLLQWWSISILDNSNVSAHRFMSINSSWKTFLAIFLPTFLFFGISFIRSIVFDTYISTHPHWADNINTSLLEMYLKFIPELLKPIVIIALLMAFINGIEELFNWGSSMLNFDLYKGYINKTASDNHYKYSGYAIMFLLLFIGSTISNWQDSFLRLIKFFFSISAGVGPAFIARWFWWRMNAWAQLSAMLSSLLYAVLYNYLITNSTIFYEFTTNTSSTLHISDFYTKLIILSLSVIFTWIITALFTPKDNNDTLQKFYTTVQPGGFWPWANKNDNLILLKKICWILLFSLANITIVIGGWILKYHNLTLGSLLILTSIIIFISGVFKIKKILQ
ncbi:sodium:solute symporter family transporter [Marinifilum sp. RC60d5]|uniref:sodium:solute symporter family transporter n=1 Tax=Marinifilum sp. RC60d5 TaxID=3458414 RepID=UPI00403700F5